MIRVSEQQDFGTLSFGGLGKPISRFTSSDLWLNCFSRLTLTCPADILSRSRERGILRRRNYFERLSRIEIKSSV